MKLSIRGWNSKLNSRKIFHIGFRTKEKKGAREVSAPIKFLSLRKCNIP